MHALIAVGSEARPAAAILERDRHQSGKAATPCKSSAGWSPPPELAPARRWWSASQ